MTVIGDARRLPFADGVAQMCVTSPPYYGLRDYGIAGQIGLEQTPAAYVAELVATFREVRRVLRDDGVLWINLGDSYSSGGNGNGSSHYIERAGMATAKKTVPDGLKPKDLLGIPWRVAFALQDDGWYLRSDIIWHKPNPMPESVTDRPTKAHEYVFLLAKSARYFYDADAVSEPLAEITIKTHSQRKQIVVRENPDRKDNGNKAGRTLNASHELSSRNARTVWTIATRPYSGAHFATMPPALAERCILAGTSQKGACPKCGAAWVREAEHTRTRIQPHTTKSTQSNKSGLNTNGPRPPAITVTTGWRPACDCNAGEPVPCIVLDPFSGSGTTERVAIGLGRRFIGTELNPAYIGLRSERVAAVQVRGL